MKKILLFLLLISFNTNAQTCQDIMEFVKSKSFGTTYTSYNSDAISKVTFYEVYIDYQTHYFAIVCFKQQYSLSCKEYIYQVASDTRIKYSLKYITSPGEAFWEYIHPYRKQLGCSPNLE